MNDSTLLSEGLINIIMKNVINVDITDSKLYIGTENTTFVDLRINDKILFCDVELLIQDLTKRNKGFKVRNLKPIKDFLLVNYGLYSNIYDEKEFDFLNIKVEIISLINDNNNISMEMLQPIINLVGEFNEKYNLETLNKKSQLLNEYTNNIRRLQKIKTTQLIENNPNTIYIL